MNFAGTPNITWHKNLGRGIVCSSHRRHPRRFEHHWMTGCAEISEVLLSQATISKKKGNPKAKSEQSAATRCLVPRSKMCLGPLSHPQLPLFGGAKSRLVEMMETTLLTLPQAPLSIKAHNPQIALSEMFRPSSPLNLADLGTSSGVATGHQVFHCYFPLMLFST